MKIISGDFFEQNTYIIKIDNKTVIIDPGYNYNQIKVDLENKKPDIVLLTHFHFDHVACVDRLCQEFNIKAYIHQKDLKFLISNNGAEMMGLKKVEVNKNNIETFTNEIKLLPSLKIIEAPGHTGGSVLYQYNNKLFTGDVLFANGSHGRVDLLGAEPLKMPLTLENICNQQENNLTVFPGHGAFAKLSKVITNLKIK